MVKTTQSNSFPKEIAKLNRSNLRKMLMVFLKRDLKNIKNKKILEIGCGDWDYAKTILEKNNNQWFGLEPVDLGRKNITPSKGSVKCLPFHDNYFDYVLCNQTIEHWFEYGVSFKRALKEINRVVKPRGTLMINAPIHVHGHPYFLQGTLKKIYRVFNKKLWKISLFERCFPPVKEKKWKKIAAQGFFSRFGYPNFLIPNSKMAFSYILNIHAIKIHKVNKNNSKTYYLRIRPVIVIIRFAKEYLLNLLRLK